MPAGATAAERSTTATAFAAVDRTSFNFPFHNGLLSFVFDFFQFMDRANSSTGDLLATAVAIPVTRLVSAVFTAR